MRNNNNYQPGDIFACWGSGFVSRAISWGTVSPLRPWSLSYPPSHVAFACEIPPHGLCWVESTSLSTRSCLVAGKPVCGVQVHRIEDCFTDRVRLYRVVPSAAFDAIERGQLTETVLPFLGLPYDMGTVLIAGLSTFSLRRMFARACGADLSQVFCSELLAHVLMRMNRLNWSNPTVYSPASLLRELVRTGVYVEEK